MSAAGYNASGRPMPADLPPAKEIALTTQAVLDALQRFLTLGDSPDDGEALFDAYAPGAMLFYDGTSTPLAAR